MIQKIATLVFILVLMSACATPEKTSGLIAHDDGNLHIKIAGYDYDRVRAIMDGQTGIEGAVGTSPCSLLN